MHGSVIGSVSGSQNPGKMTHYCRRTDEKVGNRLWGIAGRLRNRSFPEYRNLNKIPAAPRQGEVQTLCGAIAGPDRS